MYTFCIIKFNYTPVEKPSIMCTFESSYKCTRILQRYPNTVIDVLHHLVILANRLQERNPILLKLTEIPALLIFLT